MERSQKGGRQVAYTRFRKNRFGLTGVDISIGYRFGRSAKGGGK